jgi:D-alanine transfer protein
MIGRQLLAALLSIGLMAVGLAMARSYVRSVEDGSIEALAPRMFDLKNQGSELQAAAFRDPNLLVVYGSSELEQPNPYHASSVLRDLPTGFTIFPVGRGETTSLIMLQDLAAVGSAVRGKQVAISVSPPWFFLHDRPPNFYATNYSRLHLSGLIYSTDLSYATKQRTARQLLQTPKIFQDDPLVRFGAEQLADDTPVSRVKYWAAVPLGLADHAFIELQDVWSTFSYLQMRSPEPALERTSTDIEWTQLALNAEAEQAESANNNEFGFDNTLWTQKYRKLVDERRGQFNDAWFIDNLQQNAEFTDLDILLSGLSDLGAEPLLLSAPIPGKYYDTIGISAEARQLYYARLRELATEHSVPLVDFEDHDNDLHFVTDPNSHLSRKGWVYYDRALDAFYHSSLGELARTDWRASALLPGDSARVVAAVR